jgi:hypothetical protein
MSVEPSETTMQFRHSTPAQRMPVEAPPEDPQVGLEFCSLFRIVAEDRTLVDLGSEQLLIVVKPKPRHDCKFPGD